MALPDPKPWSVLRGCIAIGAVLLLASVFLNIWSIRFANHGQPNRGQFNYLQGRTDGIVIWRPLEHEKMLYREAGYDVSWLDGAMVHKLREFLGPYSIIFELFALRFYGLCTIFPLVIFTAAFGWAEGRVSFHEKIATFGNLSSTRFKVFTLLLIFSFALCFIYLTLPFGSELPVIGKIPLTVNVFNQTLWLTAPYLWAGLFALLIFAVSFQMTANFGREI